jgi:hypothetical protein
MARYRKLTIGITWRDNMSLLEQQTRAIIESEMMKPDVWRVGHVGGNKTLGHKTLPIMFIEQEFNVLVHGTDILFTKERYEWFIKLLEEHSRVEVMNNIIEMYEKQKGGL